MNDTPPEVLEAQANIYRGLSGVQRLDLAMEISDITQELSMTRLRIQRPDWSESDIRKELLRISLSSDLLLAPDQ
jgi:hypothetical protein